MKDSSIKPKSEHLNPKLTGPTKKSARFAPQDSSTPVLISVRLPPGSPNEKVKVLGTCGGSQSLVGRGAGTACWTYWGGTAATPAERPITKWGGGGEKEVNMTIEKKRKRSVRKVQGEKNGWTQTGVKNIGFGAERKKTWQKTIMTTDTHTNANWHDAVSSFSHANVYPVSQKN